MTLSSRSKGCPGTFVIGSSRELAQNLRTKSQGIVRDKTFKQTLGVPMGILCSPLDSRAYFIVRDFKFMLHLISQGRITDARKMNNTFRIADDVVAVNNLRFHQLLDEYMDWNILTLNDETQEHYTNDHGQLIPYGAPMADTYLPSRPQHPHNPLRVL